MSNANDINDIYFFEDSTHNCTVFQLGNDPEVAANRLFDCALMKEFIKTESAKQPTFSLTEEKERYIRYFDKIIKGKVGLFKNMGKVKDTTTTWVILNNFGNNTNLNFFHEEQYRGTKYGKDHHFVCSEEDFYSHRWGLPLIKNNHEKVINFEDREITKTKEVILSNPEFWSKYKDKDILIVAAGPSSKDVKWENVKHDYLWTCNEFYYSGFFDDKKLDLACLAAELDIYKNKSLDSFIEKHPETSFGFEVERGSNKKDLTQLNGFLRQYENKSYFFHTRYRGVIGMGARQIIAAIFAGAKNIYICGFDGRDRKETNENILNVFNADGKKSLPAWFHQEISMEVQYKQFYIFWGYIAKLAKEHNCSVFNLGQGHVYNKSSEITEQLLPWTDDLKETLK